MLNITEKQKELLLKYLEGANEYIDSGDIDMVLDLLDSKITEVGFTPDYELNEIGLKLQILYDEIYNQN